MRKTMKMSVCIFATVILTIGVTIIIIGMLAGGLIPFAPSYSKTDRCLKANIDELSYVADALFELDYDSIEIRKIPLRDEDKYNMLVSTKHFYQDGSYGFDNETIPIPDELVDHIKILYKSGVSVISCGHNSVSFSLWSSLSESRGIIYSRMGEVPDGEQLIEVRELSKENWYYYVHNFEKAKTRNPHLFE